MRPPLFYSFFRPLFALIFIAVFAYSAGAKGQNGIGLLSAAGPGPVVQTDQIRAELVAHAPQGIEAGQPLWLGLKLTHQPHWHTYWKNPGDSGLATQLQWTLPAGLTAGDIVWPTPQKLAIGALANFGFENTALLAVPIRVAPDFSPALNASTVEIKLHASWLVCRQECIPQEGDFVLRVPARSSTAPHAAAFEALRKAQPAAHTGAATAQVAGDTLTLQLQGLPTAWQGQPLGIFPETPDLIEAATAPEKARASAKGWEGANWSGQMVLSGQRQISPREMPVLVVLESGTHRPSVHVTARVEGNWPPVTTAVAVSPALQAALDRNAQTAVPAQGVLSGMAWAFLAALLGGLILNLMPCVFPVLAIKMLGFAQSHYTVAERRLQGLAYTAGVVLSFVALGGLLLALRAGGEQLGWGFQLQSPSVIAALALLFTLMGLNLAGQLEFGHWLPSGLASMQLRHPAADAFLSGMLAVAVASPCTAPFMGASLGVAITLPPVQALAIFAALGVGLALPYLVASWVPAVAQRLPRPGAWMDTLKRFMAFPMWATVVWLVWVLGHLSGIDGAASLLVVLLAVALVVWSVSLNGRTGRALTIFSIAVCAFLVWAVGPNVLKMDAGPANPSTGSAADTGERWQAWVPGKVEATVASGKPVFVDFTAAWCITCQVNKKTTLQNSAVLDSFAAKGVTLLRADWTRRDPDITQALQALGRSGVPVYVLYAPGRVPAVFSEILSVQDLQDAIAAL